MAKNASSEGSSFERDFGYLIPFLEKVTQAAEQMPSQAGAELRSLLSGEVAKWTRIRALLSGAAPSLPAAGAAPTASPSPSHNGSTPPLTGTHLTIGSLRKK